MSILTAESSRRFGSLSEAAQEVGVSKDTIRRRVADGTLQAFRIGPRLIRVDLDEVRALLRPIPSAKSGGARRAG
ncbi:helix-turn-helix transcriptional regulator [Solicola sp. PLA-1-18]|uniref:helix-turn-helix transcriptional regulator n=1 Tax=Solicola sp. PLA-1-18 TaxID=3380532 RepID=UPI003B7D0D1D